ncbi:MAG: ABC transporter permease [Dyadobacter sp.]|uniref:ABC transporter permease n=1 Tax=Dyadobacter sp. TaxID=1914288 RepID=UPI001AFDA0FC|nr:ABC transporter permease [Dyadobacter sp.]MBO9612558.1 ABC transporter permease [Dyadobacter sp.]
MIKNYFSIAIRSFRGNLQYTFVNLAGLSVGLMSVFLIISYLTFELSFDTHYSNSDRIYQIISEEKGTEPFIKTAEVPDVLGATLHAEFPEIEAHTAFSDFERTVWVNDKPHTLNSVIGASNFLEVFNFPFVYGNASTCFSQPESVVLNQKAADELFPGESPIGKSIKLSKKSSPVYTVTGLIRNVPPNTVFKADIIFELNKDNAPNTLDFTSYSAFGTQYILLKPGGDIDKLQQKIGGFLKKYKTNQKQDIGFIKLTDIHLRASDINAELDNTVNIKYIYILSGVCALILIIACINYINLTTARSLQRIKEVGIRKTLGSSRKQLAFQFIGESFLFFAVALALAMLLSSLVWPFFISMLNIQLPLSYLFSIPNILLLVAAGLLSGILSGVYPSLLVSGAQSAGILKKEPRSFLLNFRLRRVLIVTQFALSTILIICTLVIWDQFKYLRNSPLGFAKDHLLFLPKADIEKHQYTFKKALIDYPNVENVSFSNIQVGGGFGAYSSNTNPSDTAKRLDFAYISADYDFVKTWKIKLKEGRLFSETITRDAINFDSLAKKSKDPNVYSTRPIIVSESLVKALNIADPINHVLHEGSPSGTIIGVLKDFQLTTLKETSPLLIYDLLPKSSFAYTYIRIKDSNLPETISHIENTWKTFFPNETFTYTFADDKLNSLYDSERRQTQIFTYFASIAIIISAIGLYCLASLVVKQRNKEIGIRKVMGASVSNIAIMISGDFLILIATALIIAFPVAYFAMKHWLQDYPFRIDMGWVTFAIAAILTVSVGMLTVELQVISAAKLDPVKSLKTE